MKIADYVKETKAEMAHVTWPSRKQALTYAAAVVGVSVATALLLALFDLIFSRLLTLIV
jgi:preprotein translocase subunit SecE